MYVIEKVGSTRKRTRVTSTETMDAADFARLAADLGKPPVRARKTGLVTARRARETETVETAWNGKETTNTASPGDWIVTSLATDGHTLLRDAAGNANVYVIRAGRFEELYAELEGAATPHGARFRPTTEVLAIRLTGGFEIMAPWGEMQRAADGWLLLNGSEVYGNHRDTFKATYEVLKGAA